MKLYAITRGVPVITHPLKFEHGIYYAYEYDKDDHGRTLKIGIVCDEATDVIVKQQQIQIPLQREHNIWHYVEKTWQDEKYHQHTDSVFGFNIGGDFYIEAWKDGELLEQAHIAIIPPVFSLNEYRKMQQDVLSLIEAFSIDLSTTIDRNTLYLKRTQRFLYPLEQFTVTFNQLIDVIEEIIDAPSFELKFNMVKKHKQNIKRWTPKLIIEEMVTGKEYLAVQETVPSYNIPEHQMIRTMLEKLMEKLSFEQRRESQDISRLNVDNEKVKKTLREAPTAKNELQPLINQIDSELNVLYSRQSQLKELQQRIKTYMDINLFSIEGIEVKETHLFKQDVKYREVYRLYESLQLFQLQNDVTLQPFVKSLLKSPLLYEVWILLKMVEQFQHWGFDTSKFINWIQLKYSTVEKLEGFDEVFELEKMPFRIRVMFNKYLSDTKLKPDYIIGVQMKESTSWSWHTADAKYKVYSEKLISNLIEDVQNSAIRYKEKISIAGKSISSSVIIHPNAEVVHWNIKNKNNKPYEISQFYVKPNDTSMLRIYFKRMLHYYTNEYEICPTCNEVAEKIIEKGNILTYKCRNCSEVWVRSHCWQNECKRENLPLYKYALDNYNYQMHQKWNVHCPKCYSDLNAIYEQNSSILKENYQFVKKRDICTQPSIKVYVPRPYIPKTCTKCGGSGWIGKWRHIEGGRCFECNPG